MFAGHGNCMSSGLEPYHRIQTKSDAPDSPQEA